MLNVCITFDHELFFGENFASEEEILFEPTRRILDILLSLDVSATFFTDVCSIFKYKSIGKAEYPIKMEDQLKFLVKNKQDVQLHVHSHWFNSEFNNNKWKFDKNSYRIHSFGFDNGNNQNLTANKIIKESKLYLENLLTKVKINYKCIAFRAGGLCLQPEYDLLKVLRENGIAIDSSVCKDMQFISESIKYSFRNLPDLLNWWINSSTGLSIPATETLENCLFEVPIGSKKGIIFKRKMKKYQRSFKPDVLNGTFLPYNQPPKSKLERIYNRLDSLLNYPLMLSLDSYRYEILIAIIKDYLKKFDCLNNDYYVAVLGHNKLMGEERLKNLKDLIQVIKRDLPMVKFVTMQDIYSNITNKIIQ